MNGANGNRPPELHPARRASERQQENTRQALHAAIDRAIDSWPQALADATDEAFPSGGGGRSAPGTHADPAGNAACIPEPARTWLSDLELVRRHVFRLADTATVLWPPKARKGQVIDGVTVGKRTNDVELCGLCKKPAPSDGKDAAGKPLVHRVPLGDGHVVLHRSPCYDRVWRQAKGAGQTISVWWRWNHPGGVQFANANADGSAGQAANA